MKRCLVVSVRFLDDRYHGLLNREGPPEWPPSPFRLFQALVAGNARGREIPATVGAALQWLETLDPPVILAPDSRSGRRQLVYVLNNVSNRTRTEKMVHPTLLNGDRLLQYIWTFDDIQQDAQEHATEIVGAARHIRVLGWGIDLAIGNGEILNKLSVARVRAAEYRPCSMGVVGGIDLRTPQPGSFQSLLDNYDAVLKRYESPGITALEPGDPKYQVSGYISGAARPCAVFALRKLNEDTYSYPHAQLIHIAGMTRCAGIKSMKAFPPPDIEDAADWVKSFVAGHRREGENHHKQFSYIPLPSIGHEHADAMIRRVMIAAPLGCEAELRHLADQLDGVQLQPEGGGERPVLVPLGADGVIRQYLGPSTTWASVTPVILPGHDDHKPAKTVKLIEKALLQSGIEQSCQFTWSALPNFKNCLTAHKDGGKSASYFRPDHLKPLTAVHIRITFEHPVTGPLSIGAGRHYGLGVLAAIAEG